MTFASGAKLGPYEIQAPIGAGGMGEVYKARDTRLDRIVAIKVLWVRQPSGSAVDPIVYRSAPAGARQRQFVWVERSGKELAKVGDPYNADFGNPSLSPDGRYIAVGRVESRNSSSDLWLLDTARGVFTRFTSDPFVTNTPIWSPDGSRIVFQTNPKGVLDLYQKPATGAVREELLLASAQGKAPTDWSLDGRFLLYKSLDPTMDWDVWALPLNGDRKPFPVVQTNFEERDGQFSTDGKWTAYQSNESGRSEIYLQSFLGRSGGCRSVSCGLG